MIEEMKTDTPQQMLEAAFRALYEKDTAEVKKALSEAKVIQAFQKQWCETFVKSFAFLTQFGAKVEMHELSDLEVRIYRRAKYYITFSNNGYYLEVYAPVSEDAKCRCLERPSSDSYSNRLLELTLPEITQHISQGCAVANNT